MYVEIWMMMIMMMMMMMIKMMMDGWMVMQCIFICYFSSNIYFKPMKKK